MWNQTKTKRKLLLAVAALSGLSGVSRVMAAQAFDDNFNRAALNTGGPVTYTITTGVDGGASIVSNVLVVTNDATSAANVAGATSVAASNSSFTGYNSTLANNTGNQVTWSFNAEQIRPDPAGFGSGSYGAGFILASDNVNFKAATAKGYAVITGQSGAADPWRLVSFTGGLGGTVTNITTVGDVGAEFYSLKVVYNATNNAWSLSTRNDGTSFVDPLTGTGFSTNTGNDSTFTGVALGNFGALWNYSTTAAQTAQFDNIHVDVSSAVVVVPPKNLTWSPPSATPANTTWQNGGPTNWLDGTTPAVFTDNDVVTFADVGVGPVTVAAAGVTPGNIISITNTSGEYTFSGGQIVGGATVAKSGAGSAVFATANPTLTGNVTINGGTLSTTAGILDPTNVNNGATGLGTGEVIVNAGTLRLDNVKAGFKNTNFGTANPPAYDLGNKPLVISLNNGSTLEGVGDTWVTGGGGFKIADVAAAVTLRAPAATDRLLIGNSIRTTGSGVNSTSVITAKGDGVVSLASGGTSTISGGTQFTGSWVVDMGPTGVLAAGPTTPGGRGEVLNAFGYNYNGLTGAAAAAVPKGVGRPVEVKGGIVAIGADHTNPFATTLNGISSIRSPITFTGNGGLASTGFEYDSSQATGAGAIFSGTPVAANFSGDLTVNAGVTATVLLSDPVPVALGGTGGAHDFNIMNDSGATATGAARVLSNITWNGTVKVDPGTGNTATLTINRTPSYIPETTPGSADGTKVIIGAAAQLQILANAKVKLAGGAILSDGTNSVAIANAGTLSVTPVDPDTTATHVVGAITGTGTTTVDAGGTLTSKSVQQSALTVNGAAKVVAGSGDSVVNTLTLAGGAAPTGKLDLTNNSLVVAYSGTSPRPTLEQQVVAGFTSGTAGILTTAGTPGGLTLGIADTADVAGITTNGGGTLPANAVVVRYTYAGDATLDGSVDTADLGVMLDNFGALADPGGRQWSIGDVNYDATVDTADLGLALDNFGQLAGSGAVQAALAGLGFTLADGVETGVANGQSIRLALTGAALPEPASLGLIGVGAMTLLGRRRRRA